MPYTSAGSARRHLTQVRMVDGELVVPTRRTPLTVIAAVLRAVRRVVGRS